MTYRATVTDINRNLAATLKASGPALVSDPKVLQPVTETLIAIITKTHACQRDFGADNGEDLGSLNEISEYDWLTIDTALDTVCGLAMALGETFAQLWKMIEKPILKYASSSESTERSTAVGVISECIKGMKEAVTPFTATLLPLLLKRLTDEDSETKSNAAYAVGLLQEFSEDEAKITSAFPQILSLLEPMLSMTAARSRDNAAGCVSRMILRHPTNVPIPQVVPALLEILPLKDDFDENEPVWSCLVGLYSKGEQSVVQRTGRLMAVLAEVVAEEPEGQIGEETRGKIEQLVRYVAGKQPGEVRKYEGLAAMVQG